METMQNALNGVWNGLVFIGAAVFIIAAVLIPVIDGACHDDQLQQCTVAAFEMRLRTFQNGGHCMENAYAMFTHLCIVENYIQGLDFCCCSPQRHLAMCCRYHQGFNQFRCIEKEDSVLNTSTSLTPAIIALVILIPASVLLCCIGVIMCWCRRKGSMLSLNSLYNPQQQLTKIGSSSAAISDLLDRSSVELQSRDNSRSRPPVPLPPLSTRSFATSPGTRCQGNCLSTAVPSAPPLETLLSDRTVVDSWRESRDFKPQHQHNLHRLHHHKPPGFNIPYVYANCTKYSLPPPYSELQQQT